MNTPVSVPITPFYIYIQMQAQSFVYTPSYPYFS